MAEECVYVYTSSFCPSEIPFNVSLSTGDGSAGMYVVGVGVYM